MRLYYAFLCTDLKTVTVDYCCRLKTFSLILPFLEHLQHLSSWQHLLACYSCPNFPAWSVDAHLVHSCITAVVCKTGFSCTRRLKHFKGCSMIQSCDINRILISQPQPLGFGCTYISKQTHKIKGKNKWTRLQANGNIHRKLSESTERSNMFKLTLLTH